MRQTSPVTDANRLGIDFRHEARGFGHSSPIYDVHTHIHSLPAARLMIQVADIFGIDRLWAMSPLEVVDDIQAEFGDRIQFIAVPNYHSPDREAAFTTDWLHRLEGFREKGSVIFKIWAAPRGRDLTHHLRLDSPIRREGFELALSLGYKAVMTHVGDPDTWFATKYANQRIYDTKDSHITELERMLARYPDLPWIGAHMSGYPERPDILTRLLTKYPNYHMDTSATKWMIREWSKRPEAMKQLIQRFPGRILFGSDIVADEKTMSFDLFASRYWALRTLMETDYVGPSPIVDPDLHMVDSSVDPKSTADIHGLKLSPAALKMVYHDAPRKFFEKLK